MTCFNQWRVREMKWPAYTKPESDKLSLKYEINQKHEDAIIMRIYKKLSKIIKNWKKI